MRESRTRGIRRERLNRNLRGNFSIERVVGVWNMQAEEIVVGGTTFKGYLDRYTHRKGLEEFWPNTGNWDQLKKHLVRHEQVA